MNAAATTIPSEFRDLLDAQVAVLATMGADGYPQVSALWFLADEDGTFKLSLNSGRQKTKNLERDPEVTLFILDLANPCRYLEVRADARVARDDDYRFADRIRAKYGLDLRKVDRPGEHRLVVTLRPVKINAVSIGR